MLFPRLSLVAILSLTGVAGCSANVSGSAELADAEVSTQTAAAIVVERSTAGGETRAETRGEAVALFLRVRGSFVGDEALRIARAPVDFPLAGNCADLASLKAADQGAAIQYMDVGRVALEANGNRALLTAEQVSDIVALTSRVYYTQSDVSGLPPRTAYVLHAERPGDLEFSPLAIGANAPSDPDVRIVGQENQSAAISFGTNAPLDLTWDAGAKDDLIYVDVLANGVADQASAQAVRCAFHDSGRATIPASVLSGMQDGSISVHRLHRERFHARGIDAGEVRFDFARFFTFVRR